MAIRRRSPLQGLLNPDRWFDEMSPIRREDDGDTDVTSWAPRVDIYEQGDNLVFECEAPGVEKDDLDVSMENNRLTIRGQRREEREVGSEDRDYLRSERIYGTFQRTFSLPENVDREDIHAEYEDGVLKVRVPVAEHALRQQIEIE